MNGITRERIAPFVLGLAIVAALVAFVSEAIKAFGARSCLIAGTFAMAVAAVSSEFPLVGRLQAPSKRTLTRIMLNKKYFDVFIRFLLISFVFNRFIIEVYPLIYKYPKGRDWRNSARADTRFFLF